MIASPRRVGGVAAVSLLVAIILTMRLHALADRSIAGDHSHEAGSHFTRTVVIFAAASQQRRVQRAAAVLDGQNIRLVARYGSSGSLLTTLSIAPESAESAGADLFLPADRDFVDAAVDRGWVRSVHTLGPMRLCLVERGLDGDQPAALTRGQSEPIRIVIGDPEATASGRCLRRHLDRTTGWDAFAQTVYATRLTVSEVAMDVRLGIADRGIIFDWMLPEYPSLVSVDDPAVDDASVELALAVVRRSSPSTDDAVIDRTVAVLVDQSLGHRRDASPSPNAWSN